MRRHAVLWLLVICLASPALAADLDGGGPLTDVDFDAGTVTIRDQVFAVTKTSDLRDRLDKPMTLLQLEYELGEWVYYKGIYRRPLPVIDVLQISPDDGPGEE